MRSTILILVLTLTSLVHPEDHAVIVLYHHVSQDTPASTSVSPARFSAHLDYLSDHQFNVLALTDMIARLRSGERLPDNAVAITFDDGYRSVLTTAAPELKRRNFPFTVFVNPSSVPNGGIYLNWQELKEIQAAGGDIQNHGHRHDRISHPDRNESQAKWRQRVVEEIEFGQRAIADHLGHRPTLFAYPYGEFSPALAEIVLDMGLTGLGQHSGAVGYLSNFGGLPRHPFYTGADHIERFALRINTRPMPVVAAPQGPLRVAAEAKVELHLEHIMANTRCFFDGHPAQAQSSSGLSRQYELGPFPQRRTKFNCTKADEIGNFYWWSYLFIRERA